MKQKKQFKELKEGQAVWFSGKLGIYLEPNSYRFINSIYVFPKENEIPTPLTEKEFLDYMETDLGWTPYLNGDMLKLDGAARFYVTKNYSSGSDIW